MTTANKLDRILGRLEQIRARCPELRFGQLIATIGMIAEDETGHTIWDVEDSDFAAALERFADDIARRGSDAAEPTAAPDHGGLAPSLGSAAPQPPRQVS